MLTYICFDEYILKIGKYDDKGKFDGPGKLEMKLNRKTITHFSGEFGMKLIMTL